MRSIPLGMFNKKYICFYLIILVISIASFKSLSFSVFSLIICIIFHLYQTKTKKSLKELIIIESEIIGYNKPGRKRKMELTDQITYDILEDFAPNVKFFSIYNGHGCRGIDLAKIFKKYMRIKLIEDKNIISKFKEIKEVKLFFAEFFKSFQNKIPKDIPEYHYSGISAIIVLIVYNKMFSINLGDSRCILGQKKDKEKKCKAITIEHKISRDDEKKRISENGGKIKENNGRLMIHTKNDECLGIEISRSLGDIFGHEIGVSCEPDVFEKELNDEDCFIVIGNYGIFNLMKNNEIIEFIFNKIEINDKNKCSRLLVEECRQKWEEKNLIENKYDIEDLACIIDFINIKKNDKIN